MANFARGVLKAKNTRDVCVVENGVAAAKMPAHEFDRQSATHDHAGCFGIDIDVVFGGGSNVAFAARRSAHDYAAANILRDLWLLRQRQRNVRQRSQE